MPGQYTGSLLHDRHCLIALLLRRLHTRHQHSHLHIAALQLRL